MGTHYTDVVSRLADDPADLPITRGGLILSSCRLPHFGRSDVPLLPPYKLCPKMSTHDTFQTLFWTIAHVASSSAEAHVLSFVTPCGAMIRSSIVAASTSCLRIHGSHDVTYCDFICKGAVRCETSDVSSPVALCSATL